MILARLLLPGRIALCVSSLAGCGGAEVRVQRYAEYPEGAMRARGVLFLPLAVSDELGEDVLEQ